MNCLIENHERTANGAWRSDAHGTVLNWHPLLLCISDRTEILNRAPALPPLHVASRHELPGLANYYDLKLCINSRSERWLVVSSLLGDTNEPPHSDTTRFTVRDCGCSETKPPA